MGGNAAEGSSAGDGVEGVGPIQLNKPGAALVEEVGGGGSEFHPTRHSNAKLAYGFQGLAEFLPVLEEENRGDEPPEGAADGDGTDLATFSKGMEARRFKEGTVLFWEGLGPLKAEEGKPAEERKQRMRAWNRGVKSLLEMFVAQAVRSGSREGVSVVDNSKKGVRMTAHRREAARDLRRDRCGQLHRRSSSRRRRCRRGRCSWRVNGCSRQRSSREGQLDGGESSSNRRLDGSWVFAGRMLSTKGSEGLKRARRKGGIG